MGHARPRLHRYVAILERGSIATSVLLGQYLLVPLIVAPRLRFDAPQLVISGTSAHVKVERIGYLGELLVSVSLAVAVGLALKMLGWDQHGSDKRRRSSRGMLSASYRDPGAPGLAFGDEAHKIMATIETQARLAWPSATRPTK